MNVAQVIDVVREWLNEYGRQTDGFCGAHLMGGITSMPLDAPFPGYRDVDLNIVVRGLEGRVIQDVAYKGLIIECGRYGSAEYSSAEAILASPELGPNLVADSILADPSGMLADLRAAILPRYAEPKWISARCAFQRKEAIAHLTALTQTTVVPEIFGNLLLYATGRAGMIAVAQLKNPTNRRALALLRDLLHEQDRLDLHERLLGVLGFDQLTLPTVNSLSQDALSAFDQAVLVRRSPTHLGWKLQPYIRPYFEQGAHEMIGAGLHREAMIWIAACHVIAISAIVNISRPERDPPAGDRCAREAAGARPGHGWANADAGAVSHAAERGRG